MGLKPHNELREGMAAYQQYRQGKQALHTVKRTKAKRQGGKGAK